MKENNSMDINKSQTDGKPYEEIEEEETENTLQEQDKQVIQNKKQSQLNIDTILNVTTENKECELATLSNVHAETQKAVEKCANLSACVTSCSEEDKRVENEKCELTAPINNDTETQKSDEEDKRVEKSSKISEKIQKSQDDPNLEESDDNVSSLVSLNMFYDEINSYD